MAQKLSGELHLVSLQSQKSDVFSCDYCDKGKKQMCFVLHAVVIKKVSVSVDKSDNKIHGVNQNYLHAAPLRFERLHVLVTS